MLVRLPCRCKAILFQRFASKCWASNRASSKRRPLVIALLFHRVCWAARCRSFVAPFVLPKYGFYVATLCCAEFLLNSCYLAAFLLHVLARFVLLPCCSPVASILLILWRFWGAPPMVFRSLDVFLRMLRLGITILRLSLLVSLLLLSLLCWCFVLCCVIVMCVLLFAVLFQPCAWMCTYVLAPLLGYRFSAFLPAFAVIAVLTCSSSFRSPLVFVPVALASRAF